MLQTFLKQTDEQENFKELKIVDIQEVKLMFYRSLRVEFVDLGHFSRNYRNQIGILNICYLSFVLSLLGDGD